MAKLNFDSIQRSTPEQRDLWTWKATLHKSILDLKACLELYGSFLGDEDEVVQQARNNFQIAQSVRLSKFSSIPTVQKYNDLLRAYSSALKERAKLKQQRKDPNLAKQKELRRENSAVVKLLYYLQQLLVANKTMKNFNQ